jgi:hypothetical protein
VLEGLARADALEDRRKALVTDNAENVRVQAEAEAYRVAAVMKALEAVDPRIVQALAAIGMNPGQLIAQAFGGIAERAERIGQLNVSPNCCSRCSAPRPRTRAMLPTGALDRGLPTAGADLARRSTTMGADRKVVLVTRRTRIEGLIAKHHTLAQARFYLEHLARTSPTTRASTRPMSRRAGRRSSCWRSAAATRRSTATSCPTSCSRPTTSWWHSARTGWSRTR